MSEGRRKGGWLCRRVPTGKAEHGIRGRSEGIWGKTSEGIVKGRTSTGGSEGVVNGIGDLSS